MEDIKVNSLTKLKYCIKKNEVKIIIEDEKLKRNLKAYFENKRSLVNNNMYLKTADKRKVEKKAIRKVFKIFFQSFLAKINYIRVVIILGIGVLYDIEMNYKLTEIKGKMIMKLKKR